VSEAELRQSFVRVFEADMRGLRPRPLAAIVRRIQRHTLRVHVLLRNKEWNVLLRVPTCGARLVPSFRCNTIAPASLHATIKLQPKANARKAKKSAKSGNIMQVHLSNCVWKPFRARIDGRERSFAVLTATCQYRPL
jgi:hypothetical protein